MRMTVRGSSGGTESRMSVVQLESGQYAHRAGSLIALGPSGTRAWSRTRFSGSYAQSRTQSSSASS
jgi:hypothetical protein